MLRKNGRTRKHKLPVVEVNVVSLMDILTTLLFFLLLVASITKFSVVSATSLQSGKPDNEEKKPTFVLRISIVQKNHAEIWLGPLEGIENTVNLGKLENHLKKNFSSAAGGGYLRKLQASNSKALIQRIQKLIVPIKVAFPLERKAIVEFSDKIPYQDVIEVVSGVRTLYGADSFTVTDPIGRTEKTKVIFSEVIMSEWSGGA